MTRRQQYTARQQKYARRRRLMYRRGWKFKDAVTATVPHHATRHHDGRKTPLWNGPKQKPLLLVKSAGHGPLLPYVVDLGIPWHEIAAQQHVPPHVALDGFLATYLGPPGNKRQKFALIGYHRRRVNYVGRKPDRMTGYQRSCWGAMYFCYNNGYFPDWDPLGGHPNEADILAGADTYVGPWRPYPR